ncbi:MAG: WD40/YVTN/BNR-like repeat-containing protein [Gemmatimonadaceae bacterium]
MVLLAAWYPAACAHQSAPARATVPHAPSAISQPSGTTALLQAVSVVDSTIVWVSGHDATYARTIDGGTTWAAARVPGADSLEFRDVYAVSASTAYLLAAGPGARSRVYKTLDAGRSWTLQWTNPAARAFYDCMDFWDAGHGMAVSDAVDGRIQIVATSDGGRNWQLLPDESLPAAQPGEGAFAASGTCLVARPPGTAWIGTGSATVARVLRTTDRGRIWAATPTPMPAGASAGVTSLAFRDAAHGVAAGGDIAQPLLHSNTVWFTSDGGSSWMPGAQPPFPGAVYGAAWVPDARVPTVLVVGPKGAAFSRDAGSTWISLDTLGYWAVEFASPRAGWAVGPGGRISKLSGF